MNKIILWLDRIPLWFLVAFAILAGLAPFTAESHLIQKVRMLLQGQLSKPIDIFDLFLHGTPSVLFVIKLIRILNKNSRKSGA
jgi:hypothetical protein